MDQGSTAFVLICAALAFVAGLAMPLVHRPSGGVDHSASGSNDTRTAIAATAIGVTVLLAVLVGYASAFGSRTAPGFVGFGGVLGIDVDLVGLQSVIGSAGAGGALASVVFQCALSAVVGGLIGAALGDRFRVIGSVLFVVVWAVLVYFPVAGWVLNMDWGAEGLVDGGWLVFDLSAIVGAGVLDFAGALPIHIAGGAAVLGIALARPGRTSSSTVSSSGVLRTLLGSALLWFGWFGVTAGAEGAADPFAALATVNVLITPAAAMLAWMIVERARQARTTATGAASGVVSGLVAVTAGGAYLPPVASLVLGTAVGVICALVADVLEARLGGMAGRIVAIHVVGGAASLLYLGVFATGVGLIYSGNPTQLIAQGVGVVTVLIFSLAVSSVLAVLISRAEGRVRSSAAPAPATTDAP